MGKYIYVYWDGMDLWYCGKIYHYKGKSKKFKILYDDHEKGELDLAVEKFFMYEGQKSRKMSSTFSSAKK